MSCGASLPDDANFCLKCGKPAREGVSSPGGAPVYETGSIQYRFTRRGFFPRAIFVATAMSPSRGEYETSKSPEFRVKTYKTASMGFFEEPHADLPSRSKRFRKKSDDAFKALVTALLRDGWEPATPGRNGYFEQGFRRQERP